MRVIYNVLAKDINNAKNIFDILGEQVLVGVMVKNFPTIDDAISFVKEYQSAQIPVSVGLGAGDPAQWEKVVQVSLKTLPSHINQVFPAAGYTLGAVKAVTDKDILVNALIEPSGEKGKVYITTGEKSGRIREKVSCDMAAALMQDLRLPSVKFYPIDGEKRLDEVAEMVKAAVKAGITVFEPTGGIDMGNVATIVKTCLDNGAETVIPHLYTSLVNKATGETDLVYIKQLKELKF